MNNNKSRLKREFAKKYRGSLEHLIDGIIPYNEKFRMPSASSVIDVVKFVDSLENEHDTSTLFWHYKDRLTGEVIFELNPVFSKLVELNLLFAYYSHSKVQAAIQNNVDGKAFLKAQERDTEINFVNEGVIRSPIYRKV